MADQVRTQFIIDAKAQGFSEAEASMAKVNQKVSESAKKQAEEFESAQKRVSVLTATVDTLVKSLEKGAKNASLEDALKVVKTQAAIEKITKQVEKLKKTMEKAGQAGGKAMADEMDKVAKSAEKAAASVEKIHGGGGGGGGHGGGGGGGQRPRRPSMRQHGGKHYDHEGAFTQGFLEGILPGKLSRVIDRGPGEFRQAGGVVAGESLKEGFGGLASIPFAGEEGLVRAVESIPGIGGGAAALTSQALAMGKESIAAQGAELAVSPYLGGVGLRHGGAAEASREGAYKRAGVDDEGTAAKLAAARARGEASYKSPTALMTHTNGLEESDIQTRMAALAKQQGIDSAPNNMGMLPPAYNMAESRLRAQATKELTGSSVENRGDTSRAYMQHADATHRKWAGDAAAAEAQKEIDATRKEAAADNARKTYGSIAETGASLGGMDITQTQQWMARAAMAAGGTARDLQKNGLISTGIAAQSGYGISAETVGAFGQAGRSGGIAGQGGRNGGDMLVKGMSDAVKMGLEGSELTNYMAQMAGNIEEWKQTGMPLALDSIGDIGKSLAEAGGMGGVRGGIAAQNMVKSIQNVGAEGPQDAMQAFMLQRIGGYHGGGMADALKAQEKMENGDFSMKDVDGMTRDLSHQLKGNDANSRAGNVQVLRTGLKSMGVNMTHSEAELYYKQQNGEQLTPEEQKRVGGIRGRMQKGLDANKIRATGRAAVPEAVAEEKRIKNERLAKGDTMTGAVQDLDKVLQVTASAFTDKLGPSITKLAGIFEQGAVTMEVALASMESGGSEAPATHRTAPGG